MFVKQWRMAGRTEITHISTLIAALTIGATFWVAQPRAQGRGAPTIEIAAEIMVAPGIVTPVSVNIGRIEIVPQQAMLMIRGLPPRVTLSEGRSFSPGVWAVPVTSVSKLEMAPAHGTSGRSELTMELVTLDGKVVASTTAALYILPASAAAGVQDIPAPPAADNRGSNIALTAGPLAIKPGNPAPSTQTPASLGADVGRLSPKEIESAVAMMGKADQNMQAGQIAAARLFYKSAADSGYAPAALALGATYDGRQLAQRKVVGLQADTALARKWYERAEELGSAEATRRLHDLR